MIKKDKVNVLIFWSVNCPHCRKELPAINAWLREHPESKLNVVSVAGIPDLATKSRTKEYCDLNKFVFPTLVDKDPLDQSTLQGDLDTHDYFRRPQRCRRFGDVVGEREL